MPPLRALGTGVCDTLLGSSLWPDFSLLVLFDAFELRLARPVFLAGRLVSASLSVKVDSDTTLLDLPGRPGPAPIPNVSRCLRPLSWSPLTTLRLLGSKSSSRNFPSDRDGAVGRRWIGLVRRHDPFLLLPIRGRRVHDRRCRHGR